jgi:DNA replication and repair protein RecF
VYFKTLILSQFRNYGTLDIDLVQGLNVFTGPNGSGKTSILEAIHYLSMVRGFYGGSDKQALRRGEQFFITEGKLSDDTWIKCTFLEGRGKKMFHDQIPLDRMIEHIGKVPVISVLPADTDLIRESGTLRRKYIDALISQYNSEYLKALVAYDHALQQRNAALTAFAKGAKWDPDQIHYWDAILRKDGIFIHAQRDQFLLAYIPVFMEMYARIAGPAELPNIEYISEFKENTDQEWTDMFARNLMKDRITGRTGYGTHREDLAFTLDGDLIKERGSQGQQKSFVLALKLANFVFLKAQKEDWPILLLDDIFDKLDKNRVGALAEILAGFQGAQIFLTDTSEERILSVFHHYPFQNTQYFQVLNAHIQLSA